MFNHVNLYTLFIFFREYNVYHLAFNQPKLQPHSAEEVSHTRRLFHIEVIDCSVLEFDGFISHTFNILVGLSEETSEEARVKAPFPSSQTFTSIHYLFLRRI